MTLSDSYKKLGSLRGALLILFWTREPPYLKCSLLLKLKKDCPKVLTNSKYVDPKAVLICFSLLQSTWLFSKTFPRLFFFRSDESMGHWDGIYLTSLTKPTSQPVCSLFKITWTTWTSKKACPGTQCGTCWEKCSTEEELQMTSTNDC